MRNRFIIALVLTAIFLAALSGCKGGGQIDPPTPEPEPMLIDTTIVVPATGGTNRFTIISHSGWKASVASGERWCHVTPADGGSGGATIAVKVDANDDFSVRQARVDIKNATTTGVINIVQQQIDVLDVTTDDICDFGPQGGSFAVNVGYNIDYTVTCSEPWVRQTQTKALQRATLMFEVDKNNSGGDRTCEVTFDGGGFNHVITVSQIAAYISLSITDVALAADVDGFPVMVESNVSYSAMPPDQGWITLAGDPAAGTDGQQSSTMFNLELQENEEWFLREADVVFGNPDYNLSGSVHILQKSVDIMYASLPLFEFGPEGGSFEFDIDPTKEYTFSSGDAEWITVTTPADNPARRIITVAKSLEGEGRTASLVITRGSAKKTLDFSQAGTAPEISARELIFATAGGSQSLTVTGSVEYTLVPPADAPWCVVEQSQTGEYVVTVAANDTESSRECRFVFKNEEYGVSEEVVVSQAQKDAFEVSPLTFSFGPEGGRAQVAVHSNIDYEYQIDSPEWIVETREATDQNKVFAVSINATGAKRQGRIIFTAGGVETVVAIDQKAAFITASEHEFSFDDQPAERSFTVEGNVPFYTRIVGDQWLSIKSMTESEVSFSLEENNEWGKRTASIIVYNNDYNAADTVKVHQGAKYYLDIAQTEFDLPPQGGTVALEVISNKEYEYHIEDAPDWISETSELVFEIEPNTGGQAREARIVFEQNGRSKSVSISQDAPVLSVNPSGLDFTSAGGEAVLTVTSNIDFTLTPPSVDWLSCEPAGVSSYTVRAASNEVPETRSCAIDISSPEFSRSMTVEVVQAAKGVFELLTDSFNLGPEGGDIAVEVNTNVDYAASPDADWVTGEGLNFSVSKNTSGEERTCSIEYTADGYSYFVTITQDAAFVTVDKTQLDLPVDGGRRSFTVTANVEYEIVAPEEDWITVTDGADGTYDVEVTKNEGEQSRECTVLVTSADYDITKEVLVLQACSDFFDLSTTEFDFGPEGGVAEVVLRTNIDYTCTIGDDWVTAGGELSFNVGKNATGQTRECAIEFVAGGETYTVTVRQTAAWLTIDTESVSIEQEGGSFVVTAAGNVPFEVVLPDGGWVTAAEPTVDGEYGFEVAEYTDYGMRTAKVKFEAPDYGLSKTVTVTQKGIPDPFSVRQKEYFVGPCGGNLEVIHSECSDVEMTLSGGDWIRELPSMRNDTLMVFNLDTLFTDNTRQAAAALTGEGKTRMVYIFQNPPQMVLLYDSRNFRSNGGTSSIGLSANFRPDFYCDDDWVSCELNAVGDEIIFTAAPNDTGLARSTVVEVGLRALNIIQEVTITQEANPVIRVSPEYYTISGDGGEFYITVEANISYSFDNSSDWITVTATQEENVFLVTVQPNPSPNSRSAGIWVNGEGAYTTFSLLQGGKRNPDYYYSEDFSRNGQVTQLQQASVGEGIPLIIMGDAFTDRLLEDGTYDSIINDVVETFFAIEPYTSFRGMFDVYKVDIVSLNEIYADDAVTTLNTRFVSGSVVAGDNEKVYKLAGKIVDPVDLKKTLVIVIMNSATYGGSTYLRYLNSGVDYGLGQAISYVPLCTSEAQFKGVLQHEAGGHGFGKLDDEYAYQSHGAVPQDFIDETRAVQVLGFYKNVDFTPDPEEVLWAEFLQDERYQYDGLGVFEGACSYYTGAYRPTESSMMYHNEGQFNAPSREAIYYRLHKLAYGSSWVYDREAFVEYDAINRRTSPRASQTGVRGASAVGSQLPPLPRPVLEQQ